MPIYYKLGHKQMISEFQIIFCRLFAMIFLLIISTRSSTEEYVLEYDLSSE